MFGASRVSSAGFAAPLTSFLNRIVARVRGGNAEAVHDLASYRLLVASLFTSPTSIILSNIIGALVPYFCWATTGNRAFLWITAAGMITVLLRIVTVVKYYRVDHSNDTFSQVRAWDREYFFGATVFSLVLGINCFTTLAFTENVPSHIVTIISAIAFSSGYVARNAGRPFFVVIQVVCFCLPMAAGLFDADEPYYPMIGGFILLYVLTNIAITFSINRNLLALASVTKRSQLLAETLRRKNITLDSALNSMTHGLAMFDTELNLEICNSKFSELYFVPPELSTPGVRLQHILGHLISAQTLAPGPTQDIAAMCKRVVEMRLPATVEILTERDQTFVISAEPAADTGILMLTEDATARKATAAQIERMAHFDGLTGLANRFQFGEALKSASHDAISGGPHFSVLYMDLDNFKHVNDSLGHESGDQLLVETAKRLQQFVGKNDLVARFGGDEFVLMHFVKDVSDAKALGQRIVDAMALPFEVGGKTMYVTTSVGIAMAPEHGTDPVDVLRASDIALYAAKAAGRNAFAVFDPTMAEALYNRREIENDLREACQMGRLFLHYQPIVNLKTRQVTSCEALMRWKHPTKGIISPAVFIPVAEQTGLIAQMGDWAIRQACMDAVDWPSNVSVAVNVSAVQFKDPKRLIDTVRDALLMSRLEPNRLELEVTESLLIEDQKATLEAIRALRRIGVRFSLDDFGIGYSSLAYIARYPFSKIKIDRTFAQHVTVQGPFRSIIEVVCQLADRLGLRVVVEGIETEEQKREVEALGAELAQGYLFGRPEAAEKLMPRLKAAA